VVLFVGLMVCSALLMVSPCSREFPVFFYPGIIGVFPTISKVLCLFMLYSHSPELQVEWLSFPFEH